MVSVLSPGSHSRPGAERAPLHGCELGLCSLSILAFTGWQSQGGSCSSVLGATPAGVTESSPSLQGLPGPHLSGELGGCRERTPSPQGPLQSQLSPSHPSCSLLGPCPVSRDKATRLSPCSWEGGVGRGCQGILATSCHGQSLGTEYRVRGAYTFVLCPFSLHGWELGSSPTQSQTAAVLR